jgi:hypothetical protein
MNVRPQRLSISLPLPLARAVRRAAKRSTGGNVSAWLAEAAEEALRRQESADAVADWEAEHGKLSPEGIERARRLWRT